MFESQFSIIVPVYNTSASLLKRCLESISLQTYSSYEIIIIDDGSKKIYAEEIDSLKNNYKNIFVYHIAHQGVSNARNTGVSKANGEWIIFVDSDDVLSKYMLEDASVAIKNNKNVEIIYGYVKYEKLHAEMYEKKADKENFEILSLMQKEKLLIHLISSECDDYRENGAYISRGPVARVINKSLLLKVNFDTTLKLGEDVIWNIEILKNAHNIMVVKNIWYYYIKNDDSATQRYRPDAFIEHCKMLDKLCEIIGDRIDLRASILSRTMEELVAILNSFYLHDNYPNSLKVANVELKKYTRMESFSRFSSLEYFWKMTLKNKVKWIILMKNPYPLYLYKFMLLLGIVKK